MSGPFAPDSFLWLGIVLGLMGRVLLRSFSTALNVLIEEKACDLRKRRAHRRAIQDLHEEAGGRV